ncbi:MAG: bis(5'-nucleosyl)-tetraphosphatase (symmetrical) YqeK [Elusimicrobia bacterium]|nr:bis(5'-nucleosyl)-tetraphosphatase (symmetrical) YqeK [Elusimicrobiota bacterium]
MKILVIGGSFDPPHRGHLALLLAAAGRIKPERILILPAYQTPLKSHAPGSSAAERLAMVNLGLVAPLPRPWKNRASVERFELSRRRLVYTLETLRHIRRKYPASEIHFAVGSDCAASFYKWKNPEKLQALCQWWAAERADRPGAIPDFFNRINDPMPEISSTSLRSMLFLGEIPGDAVVPGVMAFIEKKKLYGRGLLDSLKKSLSPVRLAHCLAVARLAEALAERWKLDCDRARLAGLLHDCGRAVAVPKMPAYARKHGLEVPELDQAIRFAPLILHAYISEHLARTRYGVRDPAILSAIRKHTLGDLSMSALDKVLYAADAASEDRLYPEAAELRRAAFEDLDKGFRECVLNKLRHALNASHWLHPLTVGLWNSLQE